MSAPRLYGAMDVERPARMRPGTEHGQLSVLSVELVPLTVISEWTRCGDAADFVARFFAHDFGDRELAANVLSTVVNELLENAVKFSSDKTVPARLSVREYPDQLTIATSNVVTLAQGAAFGDTITRIVRGDPERMFAEQVANPPETGGAGIGLIILRKDYDARLGLRLTPMAERSDAALVEVEVTIDNREIESL